MLEATGTVISVDNQFAWVELQRTSSCGQCHVEGCGNAVLAQALKQQAVHLQITNHLAAKVGDTVIVGQQEAALLKSAFIMYLLPLLSALFFGVGYTVLAELWQWPVVELFTMTTTVIGFVLGLLIVRSIAAKMRSHTKFQPVLLRVLETNNPHLSCNTAAFS